MNKLARIYKTDIITLKKIMVEKGLDKINELSDASGVDRNTLSKIIRGEAQPSSTVMDKLIKTLELEPEVAGRIFFAEILRIT